MQASKSAHHLQSAMIVESNSSNRNRLYVSVQTASLVQFHETERLNLTVKYEYNGWLYAPNPRYTEK